MILSTKTIIPYWFSIPTSPLPEHTLNQTIIPLIPDSAINTIQSSYSSIDPNGYNKSQLQLMTTTSNKMATPSPPTTNQMGTLPNTNLHNYGVNYQYNNTFSPNSGTNIPYTPQMYPQALQQFQFQQQFSHYQQQQPWLS